MYCRQSLSGVFPTVMQLVYTPQPSFLECTPPTFSFEHDVAVGTARIGALLQYAVKYVALFSSLQIKTVLGS